MLATPPPSRAARARKVSAVSPASSKRVTASEMTASMECDARRRPLGERSRARLRGAGMALISPHEAAVSNRVPFQYRTMYDIRTPFDTKRKHHDDHRPRRPPRRPRPDVPLAPGGRDPPLRSLPG